MIDTNNIKCLLEGAWVEFARTGEITNSSADVILAMEELLKENEYLKDTLEDLIRVTLTHNDLFTTGYIPADKGYL